VLRWMIAVLSVVCCLGAEAVLAQDTARLVSFELDVQPIFTRLGCNAGACHGKSRGQNGFQLSLLGFNPDFDFIALTQEARGRRVFAPSPDSSLILLKASGQLPHGGGKRLDPQGPSYAIIRRWIEQGLTRHIPQ
jgi:hypothetical protein